MMRELVLWGATGQARVLNELAQQIGWRVVLIVDNKIVTPPLNDVPVVTGVIGLDDWILKRDGATQLYGAVAVGGNRGADRLVLMDVFVARGVLLPELVHPTSFVALDAIVGSGCQVLANSSICSHVRLGRGVIINTAAIVDHDSQLADGVHIGPGAHLAGEIRVGLRAFVGAGAVVLPRIVIGSDAVVGAGAVVTKNVASGTVVVGNPARPMRVKNVR